MNDIQRLHEDFQLHLESDRKNFEQINAKLDVITTGLKSWTETYDGVMFTRKFLIGTAGLILAIAAIGGGFMWVVDYIRQKP